MQKEHVLCLITQSCLTFCVPMDCILPGFSVHGDSLGKNTGVGCHALFHGICPTQGWKPDLPYCRWILYCLSHQGSQRILEWVAYPFLRRSSRPRNWTRVSCSAGIFFTIGATREATEGTYLNIIKTIWKTYSLHHIQCESFKALPLRSGTRQTYIQYSPGIPDKLIFNTVLEFLTNLYSIQSWNS